MSDFLIHRLGSLLLAMVCPAYGQIRATGPGNGFLLVENTNFESGAVAGLTRITSVFFLTILTGFQESR